MNRLRLIFYSVLVVLWAFDLEEFGLVSFVLYLWAEVFVFVFRVVQNSFKKRNLGILISSGTPKKSGLEKMKPKPVSETCDPDTVHL